VSWVVDNPAAQQFTIKGGDGVARELYQLPGELNGKSGVFEWMIDRSGTNPVIRHQRFIPGGSITGYPNQVIP
jgi:filamentous hemagglutinin